MTGLRRGDQRSLSGWRGGREGKTHDISKHQIARLNRAGLDWPTLALALGLYAAFGLLTWFHAALPWWVILPLGGALVCLHGSLQHEVVHGHPTPWPWVNEALVFPNLWLWMPFRLYRRCHLAHHRVEVLTDPLNDPESFYVTAEDYRRRSAPGRALLWVLNTAAGRLLLGPAVVVWTLYRDSLRKLRRGDGSELGDWGVNLLAVALVLGWVLWVCQVPLWAYLLLYVYPGVSLTLLRSYLEHQAAAEPGQRSVVVEAGPLFSLLFLNNNLHALHHDEPGLAWYRLPARYRQRRAELLAANGGYRFGGYLEIIWRYLLRPKEAPVHPMA